MCRHELFFPCGIFVDFLSLHPGVVDGSGMPTYPHQVMYMQVPHSMGPQPQWHQMVQGPWVGSYMVHPSQQNLQQKSSGVPSLARASSVPDESMGASWSQPRSPGMPSLYPSFFSSNSRIVFKKIQSPQRRWQF